MKNVELLLIEDNPGDARLIQEYLSAISFENYQVRHVTCMQDAVLELMDWEPQIVILDLGLPDTQGLDTVQEFLQHHDKAPVVVLTGNDDMVLGTEAIKCGAQDFLNKGEIDQGSLVRVIHFALERKAGEARLRDLLRHDPLTELPNRRQLKEELAARLARLVRTPGQVGVLHIDINGFKQVNDRYGFAVGDRYLKKIAHSINQLAAESDLCARSSGDEFALVTELGAETHNKQLADTAQRMLDTIAAIQTGKSQQDSMQLDASIGIAVSASADIFADSLLAQAEAACQRAKSESQAGYCFFDSEMEKEARRRLAIGQGIQHALERNEYHQCWQPILDMERGALVGLETLLRWAPGKQDKLVPPSLFIPILEESNKLFSVGEWIIANACETYSRWIDAGLLAADVKIFINTSARQFEDPAFSDMVGEIIARNSMPAGSLVFEINEGMISNRLDSIQDVMRKLIQAGVEFALDDFGAGLSPLKYLFDLPFQYLKIDQRLVQRMQEQAGAEKLARSVIGLGKGLQMQLIAEGVESSQISEKLIALGCPVQQGYLHARPMKSSDLETWVRSARH